MRINMFLAALLSLVAIATFVFATPALAVTSPAGAIPGDGGYIAVPAKSTSQGVMPMVSSSITQGQTNWHYRLVNYYTTSLNYDLNWGNSANSLRLRIYTPDGYVLGPYYDLSDGRTDGRINIDITKSGGVAQGTWYSEVYGDRVTGTQSYTI